MSYYVIGGDGQQYGPEEVATLIQWAREGRLVHATVLIEVRSGRRILAGDLPVLAQNLPRVAVQSFVIPTVVPTLDYSDELPGSRNRVAAGLLGIFLGGLGAHRFYMGYMGVGLIQLALTLASCGVGHVWGLIEGIICLTGGMRDADGRALR